MVEMDKIKQFDHFKPEWKFEPRPTIEKDKVVGPVWVNLQIKRCLEDPDNCHFADEDEDKIKTHIAKFHKQLDFDGSTLSTDDRKILALEASPNTPVHCPFCLTGQRLRAMRLFNAEGVMLKNVRCVECRREMRHDSTTATRDAYKFGLWVGDDKNRSFWHKRTISHAKWMALLQKLYPKDLQTKFWEGYGFNHPAWAEKQRVKQQAEEYERSFRKRERSSDTDDEDEGGR